MISSGLPCRIVQYVHDQASALTMRLKTGGPVSGADVAQELLSRAVGWTRRQLPASVRERKHFYAFLKRCLQNIGVSTLRRSRQFVRVRCSQCRHYRTGPLGASCGLATIETDAGVIANPYSGTSAIDAHTDPRQLSPACRSFSPFRITGPSLQGQSAPRHSGLGRDPAALAIEAELVDWLEAELNRLVTRVPRATKAFVSVRLRERAPTAVAEELHVSVRTLQRDVSRVAQWLAQAFTERFGGRD
ncbi:MAG: hypothetical protein RL885_06230 [Planctomycetota bacterium]